VIGVDCRTGAAKCPRLAGQSPQSADSRSLYRREAERSAPIVIEARLQQEILIRSQDRVGVLAEATRVLSDMGINVLGIRLQTREDEATIHLLTNSQTYACQALRSAGYDLCERDVVVLELPHHPGFLRRASEALARKEISINDLYLSVSEEGKTGVVVLTCSNNAHAIQLLRGY
jgi:hypothetical protein